jgi:hypothetical protein
MAEEERRVLCSRCLDVVEESRISVLPSYNDEAGGYVTAYRCERCRQASLDAARARLADSADADEVASLAGWFERYNIFLHEFRRGDPLAVVRALLGRMLDLLEAGAIRPAIGPASAALAEVAAIVDFERLADAAEEAMYEARPPAAKDHYDDARGYLGKAIAAAERAGLDAEAARLAARRERLSAVWDHQFRGIG